MMGDGHMVHVCANGDYKLAGDVQKKLLATVDSNTFKHTHTQKK